MKMRMVTPSQCAVMKSLELYLALLEIPSLSLFLPLSLSQDWAAPDLLLVSVFTLSSLCHLFIYLSLSPSLFLSSLLSTSLPSSFPPLLSPSLFSANGDCHNNLSLLLQYAYIRKVIVDFMKCTSIIIIVFALQPVKDGTHLSWKWGFELTNN